MIQDQFPYQLQERLDRIEEIVYEIELGARELQNPEKVLHLLSIICMKLQWKIEKLIEEQVEEDAFTYNANF